MTETYGYQFGADILAEIGRMRAFGDRVLVRAILRTDSYDIHKGGFIHMVRVYDSASDVDAFVVLSLGGGCAKWCEDHGEKCPAVGDHIDARSTSADRVAQSDPTSRYWLIPIAHVTAIMDRVPADDPALVAALAGAESLRAEKSIAIAAASARV